MKTFIESCLDATLTDGYGLTEIGARHVRRNHRAALVIDYKLVDVPELGYFNTDRPYPRGELLVKTQRRHARVLQAAGGDGGGLRRRRLLPHR